VWSWHPLLVSSRAEASIGPTGCVTPFNPRGDGDKNELVAGESTKEPVKTIAQGRPDDPGHTCGDYRVLSTLARGLRVQRAPGLPCALVISGGTRTSHQLGAPAAREREGVSGLVPAV
jgi:hypothetical protein